MKDIKGYEGLYAATEDGRIFSYRRKKYLKPYGNGKGYKIVRLCKDCKTKEYLVHRIIIEAFLPNPDNLPQVNHKDENKANNALSNLEWISPKNNINYGTGKERRAKSCQKKVICIETQEVFESINAAAKAVDIDPSGISNCLAGRYKTAGGYHWKYYD